MIKVVVDAMGGDNAPVEIIKGSIKALDLNKDLFIQLVGKSEIIKENLKLLKYDKKRIELIEAPEIIEMSEPPVLAIRKKKASSIVVGMNMLKNNEAQAFVSAGSTGAILVGGQFIVGRISGIQRPALAPLIPTQKGVSLLIDCGANVDARASHLVQFAKMGSIYMEKLVGIKNPRVAIVNIGAEEEKGNSLVKEAFPLLKEIKDINFIGSIEARDIPKGYADVIVCEAFVGNIILKLYEGVGLSLFAKIKEALMSNLQTKIGALLIKKSLKKSLKSFDVSEYGGAPLIGLNSLVIKAHGSSKANEICNAILQSVDFNKAGINKLIKDSLN